MDREVEYKCWGKAGCTCGAEASLLGLEFGLGLGFGRVHMRCFIIPAKVKVWIKVRVRWLDLWRGIIPFSVRVRIQARVRQGVFAVWHHPC